MNRVKCLAFPNGEAKAIFEFIVQIKDDAAAQNVVIMIKPGEMYSFVWWVVYGSHDPEDDSPQMILINKQLDLVDQKIKERFDKGFRRATRPRRRVKFSPVPLDQPIHLSL